MITGKNSVPDNANVVNSHTLFMIKSNDGGSL